MRIAVEALPRHTREAMLRGIESNTIIAGAYTDPRVGGICPMLAAHRNGGRTAAASFARSWDRFTGANRPRCATPKEVERLRTYLELSLLKDDQDGKSVAEIAADERARRARPGRKAPVETGETNRASELRGSPGWGWLRPVRKWDGYLDTVAAAREQLHEQRAAEAGARDRVSV
jgi:hypothetical protein